MDICLLNNILGQHSFKYHSTSFMKQTIPLFIALSVSIFFGCKKEDKDDGGNNINNHLEVLGGNSEAFTFDASTGDTIVGPQGTRLILKPNSFYYKKDNTPASGQIMVSLFEIYSKGGLIHFNKPTISNGEFLVSGGVAHVRLGQNEDEIYSTDSRIQFPAADPTVGMRAFRWIDASQTWEQYIEIDLAPENDGDNIYRYNFPLPQNYNWINCDRFYDNPGPYTSVVCDVPGSHKVGENNYSSTVFMVLKDQFSVIRLSTEQIDNRFTVGHLPLNIKYSLVAVKIKNYQVEAAFKEDLITGTPAVIHSMALQAINNSDLKLKLASL